MTEVIYKYSIPTKESFELTLPVGATIIRVDDVDGYFYIWAVIDTDVIESEVRRFEMYKTGMPFRVPLKKLKYIGFCKHFIGMELCLYLFEVIDSVELN